MPSLLFICSKVRQFQDVSAFKYWAWSQINLSSIWQFLINFSLILLATILKTLLLISPGLFLRFFFYRKEVARTQSLIEFQNSVLITKYFQALQEYLLRIISNMYYLFPIRVRLANQSEHLILEFSVWKEVFSPLYLSFSVWDGECILVLCILDFLFSFHAFQTF